MITEKWTCPYCQTINKIVIDPGRFPLAGEIMYCDEEEGGCGRRVVITTRISASVCVQSLSGERDA